MMSKKWIVYPLLIAGSLLLLFTFFGNPNAIDSDTFVVNLMDKEQTLLDERPEDRIYAQFDKSFYEPGETIWYSAHLREGHSLMPSQKSEIVHAELVNSKGEVVLEQQVLVENGIAKGDFQLAPQAAGGKYEVRMYTNWQKNDAQPAFFTKEITVQKVVMPEIRLSLDFLREGYGKGASVLAEFKAANMKNKALANQKATFQLTVDGKKVKSGESTTDEAGIANIKFDLPNSSKTKNAILAVQIENAGLTESIVKSVPLLAGNIGLEFFPEGGEMLAGIPTKIGIKALDDNGEPTDVSGVLLDEDGQTIEYVSTLHNGMGAMSFTPEKGMDYSFQITEPKGIDKTYDLPSVASSGLSLSLKESNKDQFVFIVGSSSNEEVTLLANVRGKTVQAVKATASKGLTEITIPAEDMPQGVVRFTLFNESGVPAAERLAFSAKENNLDIQLTTDKESYQPGEEIILNIETKDQDGKASQADLSMAVVDDKLLSYANDESGNLLTWMLLEADVRSEIKDASYYLDEENPEAFEALDHVLLTDGWRRFAWKEVVEGTNDEAEFLGEKKSVTGKVVNENGDPIKGAKLLINGINKPLFTNAKGEFSLVDAKKDFNLIDQPLEFNLTALGQHRQQYQIKEYGYYQIKMFARMKGDRVDPNSNQETQAIVLGIERPQNADNEERTSNSGLAFADLNYQMVGANAQWEGEQAPTVEVNEGAASSTTQVDYRINLEKRTNEEKVATNGLENGYESVYYRAREFSGAKKKQTNAKRSDFRTTVFWNGHIRTDENGKAQIRFFNNDAISAFKIVTEGFGAMGQIGRAEQVYQVEKPYSMAAKIPSAAVGGDRINIPVTFKNNTGKKMVGTLKVNIPDGMIALGEIPSKVSLNPNEEITLFFPFEMMDVSAKEALSFSFKSQSFEDELEQEITILPKGFPIVTNHAGVDAEVGYEISIEDPIEGTPEMIVTAYPDAMGEILKGMDGMLKEPTGCFEQTMSKAYPNVMALEYLRETEQSDPEIEKKAERLLAAGYKNIKKYRKGDGFGWFDGEAKLGLTAYGLMFFTHSNEVWPHVEKNLLDASVDFLLSRKDGKGGFVPSVEREHAARATNAYVVYALTEAGEHQKIQSEIDATLKAAVQDKDPYALALMTNVLFKTGDKRAPASLISLMEMVDKNGVRGARESAMGSHGQALGIETKALILKALLQSEKPDYLVAKSLADELKTMRSGNGMFGSTQSTVFALSSLKDYASFSRLTREDGSFDIMVNGEKVGSGNYGENEREPIVIAGLGKHLKEGIQQVSIRFGSEVEYPLPHTVEVVYSSLQPSTSKDCPIAVTTQLNETTVKLGEAIAMRVNLSNETNERVNSPLTVLGVPAGAQIMAKELDQLKADGHFDYYEIQGSNIILYHTSYDANYSNSFDIPLQAAVPGRYVAPASSSYAYYQDEDKQWDAGSALTIEL